MKALLIEYSWESIRRQIHGCSLTVLDTPFGKTAPELYCLFGIRGGNIVNISSLLYEWIYWASSLCVFGKATPPFAVALCLRLDSWSIIILLFAKLSSPQHQSCILLIPQGVKKMQADIKISHRCCLIPTICYWVYTFNSIWQTWLQ